MNNICKIYNQGKENEFHALKNISLHVEQGEFLIVVGKSGAGKTTLLNILGCIDRRVYSIRKRRDTVIFWKV